MFRLIIHNLCLIAAVSISLQSFAGETRTLKGTVCLKDTVDVPAAFSTIYLPEMRSGTTVSPEGDFSLEIAGDIPSGKVRVECSYIGYETVVREVVLGAEPECVMDTIYLVRQNLMLPAAYVLPGYRDPADYILEQVSRQAAENRRNYTSYSMSIDYDFHTYELPVMAEVVSKFILGSAKAVGGLVGYGPLVKYALDNEDVSASVSFKRKIENGETYDSDLRLIRCSPELPDNVKKNVLDASSFIDLTGLIYSDECLWGKKQYKKYKFNLTGSYQWGDYLVDVLKWTDRKGHLSATVHVVEDIWGILKVEAGYDDKMIRCEARDIGGGYFLPVSLTVTPSFFPLIKAEDIPEYIEKVRENKKLDKGTRKRLIRALENHLDKDFHPYVVGSFSVRYQSEQ